MRPRSFCHVLCVLLAATDVMSARDWFVAPPPFGSDVNPGTADRPLGTINRGAAVALAGDTVWISPGTYQPTAIIKPANSGTATAPITFRALPGGDVVIDGQFKVPNYSWDAVFWIDRKDWIVFDGLRVINSAWFGISAGDATGISILNCSTADTYASGIYVRASASINVLRNTVQRACTHPRTTPLKDTQECISLTGVTDFEVAHNTVFDRWEDTNNGGEGIDTKDACRNGRVHHNVVFDLVRLGIYCDAYGSLLENVEIFANTVDHASSGIVVACENGGTARGVNIHDNVIHDCPRLGIRLAGYLLNGPIQDALVQHNTIVRCGLGPSAYENSAILVEADNPANRSFLLRHNIFSGNANTIRTKAQAYLTIDRNLHHRPSLVTGTNAVTGDPLFVDGAANDFRLRPDSPAVDRATGPVGSTFDRDGRMRPVDGNNDGVAVSDLGAYESPGPGALVPNAAARLANFSVRTSLAGAQTLIAGFGTKGGAKPLLVRAIGPGLAAYLDGALADPRITFYNSVGVALDANDDWPASLAPVFASVGAFPLAPGSRDAAVSRPLEGEATAHITGTTSGIVLLEVYDLSPGIPSRLTNFAARHRVGSSAEALIAGFVVSGAGLKNVLLRGIGPGLTTLGVPGALATPRLEVFSGSTIIADNTGWSPWLAPVFASVGAFALQDGSADTALALTLAPGAYTVRLSAADNREGDGLIEIYELP